MDNIKVFFYKIFKQYKCYVTFFLILINVLIYAGMFIDSGSMDFDALYMYEKGAMLTGPDIEMEWYRLVASMFLHFDLEHLLNNMLMLAVVGSMIEQLMGSIGFAGVYMIGGILGNVLSYHMHMTKDELVVAAGASGGVFAVSGALVWIFLMIRNRLNTENNIGQRMILFVILLLVQCFSKEGVDNFAHFGGLVAGFLLAVIFMGIRMKYIEVRKQKQYNDAMGQ